MSEKEINSVIAKNLNYYLNETGKTQIDLSLFMNVSQATVSNWCKGLKMPRMDKIDKICSFFNISRSDLMEEKKEDVSSSKNKSLENRLLSYFAALNDMGKEEAAKRVQELTHLPQYSTVNENENHDINIIYDKKNKM